MEISRRPSCSRLISREKIATFFPEFFPASRAMFSASEVLPMLGRAARIKRPELFRPEMRRSRSIRPVEIPGNSAPWACRSLMVSHTEAITPEMCSMPLAERPWRIA